LSQEKQTLARVEPFTPVLFSVLGDMFFESLTQVVCGG
jgi:hypothetical protein